MGWTPSWIIYYLVKFYTPCKPEIPELVERRPCGGDKERTVRRGQRTATPYHACKSYLRHILLRAVSVGWASGEAVGVLTFLLPGFVAAGIFHSLTSYPKPAAFDRIVLALIFAAVAQTVTEYGLLASGIETGNVGADAAWEPALSVTVAVLLGLGASCLSNTDALHRLLRQARVTRETSHPTEWYSTFARYGESCCVVPHLQKERRL